MVNQVIFHVEFYKQENLTIITTLEANFVCDFLSDLIEQLFLGLVSKPIWDKYPTAIIIVYQINMWHSPCDTKDRFY